MSKTVHKKSTAKKGSPKKQKKTVLERIVHNKPYIELITALLTIPFLITVIILNFNYLKNLNGGTPTPTPEQPFKNGGGFFAEPVDSSKINSPSITADPATCTRALGPVVITSPGENDTVTDNPVIINIEYDDSVYCEAAWSYRINGGSWSGYDDRSVALYNLPKGQVTFDLRVKSIVTSEEKSLNRKFLYNGHGSVLVPDPNSSSSAN